ncbi:MAG: 2-oxoacid:acceptor oxidoreductase family protein [Deltaproteobacteria bacterium]|nr:2-oxoacid:acceptor oxidoreductase family protein [Deltaproteobacteria bacterium]MBW2081841.1 2-oxoacid:acceptor oxidoreductase family protein [Deltaproteobacteria bacterium]HDM10013.1 pyruvate ferredoxin oxidoreductase [Desulfobacteraceae bacterium]
MQEIRFHGRGGQGAVVGSETLAHAFFLEDKFVQAFPAFGVERRGAPVMAFCRVDDTPINLRNQIYEPDHIVVLDSSLLETVNVTEGLKKGGCVVINGRRPGQYYRSKIGEDFKVFLVDAGRIAVEHGLGSVTNPIVNTAILGAFAKATGLVSIEAVEKAIMEYVPVKRDGNRLAARAAYEKAKAI